MTGWHYGCNGPEPGQMSGEREGQGGQGAAVHGGVESRTGLKKSSSIVHEIGAR